MRNKQLLKRILCFMLSLAVLFSIPGVQVPAKSSGYTVADLQRVIDGVLAYKQKQGGVSSVQKLIDEKLSGNAGKNNTTDWLIIALCRYRNHYDYSNYLKALDSYTSGAGDIKAVDQQRMALIYSAAKGDSDFINAVLKDSIGQLGIMSYIYGLILLDSGDYTCEGLTRDDIKNKIISMRLSDGGWALSGSVSDIDITAMALQALAPYKKETKTASAIDRALTLLSGKQQDTGDYKSWGNRCCESTAQVITALSALDINCQKDKRFIKKNKTLIDGLMQYRLSDGSFSHLIGGKSDNTASVQAMYSLIAVWRQKKEMASFYSFQSKGRKDTASADNTAVTKSEVKTQDKASKKADTANTNTVKKASGKEPTAKENKNPAAKNSDMQLTVVPTAAVIGAAQSQIAASGKISGAETVDGSQIVTGAAKPSIAASSSTDIQGVKVAEETAKAASQADRPHMDYRVIVTMFILAAAAVASLLLFVRKRLNRKKILMLLAFAGVAIVAVWGIKLQSAKDYYQTNAQENEAGEASVIISIRCDTAAGKKTESDLPADGTILKRTELTIRDGDSVLDILIRAVKRNKIPLDYEGDEADSLSAAYVKGIDDLYEYDYGDQSGWLYRINGEFPGVACGDYPVSDQDVIEWVYTCNLGKDVGRQ